MVWCGGGVWVGTAQSGTGFGIAHNHCKNNMVIRDEIISKYISQHGACCFPRRRIAIRMTIRNSISFLPGMRGTWVMRNHILFQEWGVVGDANTHFISRSGGAW